MKKTILIIFCLSPFFLHAENLGKIDMGLRLQKAHNLYWENGVSLSYTHPKLLDERLGFGLSYFSSRFGTAFNSNALKQDNYLFFTMYNFMHNKNFQPLLKINLGYFNADYEYEIFDNLPNTSFLFSVEGGVSYAPSNPIRLEISGGYNLITGNGVNGPGTIFPLFYQMTISWQIWEDK